VTSFPWAKVSDDPLGRYLELRDGVRLEAASGLPPRDRAPGRLPRMGYGGLVRSVDH
jgi:hypothetical protein